MNDEGGSSKGVKTAAHLSSIRPYSDQVSDIFKYCSMELAEVSNNNNELNQSLLKSVTIIKCLKTKKEDYNLMGEAEKADVVNAIEEYFANLGALDKATQSATKEAVRKMRELEIWRARGVDEESYFECNPRFQQINERQKAIELGMLEHLKTINGCWGKEGLQICSKGGIENPTEALVEVRKSDLKLLSDRYLTGLSKFAKRSELEVANKVYQLANMIRVTTKLNKLSIDRANIMLTQKLKEAGLESRTYSRTLANYTKKMRQEATEALQEKLEDQLQQKLLEVAEYSFHEITWEISYSRVKELTATGKKIARVTELFTQKKPRFDAAANGCKGKNASTKRNRQSSMLDLEASDDSDAAINQITGASAGQNEDSVREETRAKSITRSASLIPFSAANDKSPDSTTNSQAAQSNSTEAQEKDEIYKISPVNTEHPHFFYPAEVQSYLESLTPGTEGKLEAPETDRQGMVWDCILEIVVLVHGTLDSQHARNHVRFLYKQQPVEMQRLKHTITAHRPLAYLKATKTLALTFKSVEEFHGFSDSDWAGDSDTRRSTSGYVYLFAGAAIIWKTTLQPTISRSTTEVKYMAMSDAAREAVWLCALFKQLRGKAWDSTPTRILCDNQGAMALASNPVFYRRTKHIDVRFHHIRQLLESEVIKFEYAQTQLQVADVLTKSLPKDAHWRHLKAMSLEDLSSSSPPIQVY